MEQGEEKQGLSAGRILRRTAILGLVLGILGAGGLGLARNLVRQEAARRASAAADRRDQVAAPYEKLEGPWVRVPDRRAGSRVGRTFEAYAKALNGLTLPAGPIVLLPLGEFDPDGKQLARAARLLAAFSGREVKIFPRLKLPDSAYDKSRKQHSGEALADYVEFSRPQGERKIDENWPVLAICKEDIFGGSYNFVFSWRTKGVGVISTYRLSRPGRPVEPRLFVTLVDVLGHIVHMDHCYLFECAMNSRPSLSALDGLPLGLCPSCERKYQLVLGYPRAGRFEKLAASLEALGYAPEAKAARRAGEALARADWWVDEKRDDEKK